MYKPYISEAATGGALLEASNFIKTETLAQVFSREFCEISKSTFFTEHLQATASVNAIFDFCDYFTSLNDALTLHFQRNKPSSLVRVKL